jgi:hypothetical protein
VSESFHSSKSYNPGLNSRLKEYHMHGYKILEDRKLLYMKYSGVDDVVVHCSKYIIAH